MKHIKMTNADTKWPTPNNELGETNEYVDTKWLMPTKLIARWKHIKINNANQTTGKNTQKLQKKQKWEAKPNCQQEKNMLIKITKIQSFKNQSQNANEKLTNKRTTKNQLKSVNLSTLLKSKLTSSVTVRLNNMTSIVPKSGILQKIHNTTKLQLYR